MSEAPAPDMQKQCGLTASPPQATFEPAAATVSAVLETEYTQGVRVTASSSDEQASGVFCGRHDSAARAYSFRRPESMSPPADATDAPSFHQPLSSGFYSPTRHASLVVSAQA